jgi:hypothetical protein
MNRHCRGCFLADRPIGIKTEPMQPARRLKQIECGAIQMESCQRDNTAAAQGRARLQVADSRRRAVRVGPTRSWPREILPLHLLHLRPPYGPESERRRCRFMGMGTAVGETEMRQRSYRGKDPINQNRSNGMGRGAWKFDREQMRPSPSWKRLLNARTPMLAYTVDLPSP